MAVETAIRRFRRDPSRGNRAELERLEKLLEDRLGHADDATENAASIQELNTIEDELDGLDKSVASPHPEARGTLPGRGEGEEGGGGEGWREEGGEGEGGRSLRSETRGVAVTRRGEEGGDALGQEGGGEGDEQEESVRGREGGQGGKGGQGGQGEASSGREALKDAEEKYRRALVEILKGTLYSDFI
jgi:hypothetical protein